MFSPADCCPGVDPDHIDLDVYSAHDAWIDPEFFKFFCTVARKRKILLSCRLFALLPESGNFCLVVVCLHCCQIADNSAKLMTVPHHRRPS